jgi:hypothetical protein
MSSRDITRVEQLESQLVQLSTPTSKLQQVQKYLLDSSFFSDFSKSLSNLTKQVSALDIQLRSLKGTIGKFTTMVAAHSQKLSSDLQRVSQKRLKETDAAVNRTVDLENQYKQFKLESNLSSQGTLNWMKREAMNLRKALQESIETTSRMVKDRLKGLEDLGPEVTELVDSARETVLQMHTFESLNREGLIEAKTHTRKRQSMSSRSSLDVVSIRDQLLDEVTSRLAGAVEDIRQKLDRDYTALYTEYGNGMLQLRGEIQAVQERIKTGHGAEKGKAHPDNQLVQLLSEAQKTLTSLAQYAERGLDNVRDICLGVRDSLTEAQSAEHKDVYLQSVRAQLDQCQEQFRSYETRNNSDLYTVQDTLDRAERLFKQLLLFEETPERFRLLKSEGERMRSLRMDFATIKKTVLAKQHELEDEIFSLSDDYHHLSMEEGTRSEGD